MNDISAIETQELVRQIETLESAYRAGKPLASDDTFDHVYVAELRKREPNHELLERIGAEPDFGIGKIVHPRPMLSTEKAYSAEELSQFVDRVESCAKNIGVPPENIEFVATAKLDGMAARYDGKNLVTRGDGLKGNNVSDAIEKGVVMGTPGVGELVMLKEYFDDFLNDSFEHPRNVVVGAVSAKVLNDRVEEALESGAIRFVNYEELPRVRANRAILVRDIEAIEDELVGNCVYPTDGIVIEVAMEELREAMSSTSHHHRWMIAKKRRGEAAITTVEGVRWTTGRTGRVTPTALIRPVRVSGALLSRVTAHHAGNVKRMGIGTGAEVRVVRQGEVIPFCEAILSKGTVELPESCPSCNEKLRWQNDFLVCPSLSCDAQLARRLHHFFDIVGNLNLFGKKTIEKLVNGGYRDLVSIYRINESELLQLGFGPKQAKNLRRELDRSRRDALEDWRFLGAMGIHHLGRGSARRLLKIHRLETLDCVSAEELAQVESFGPVVAPSIRGDLTALWQTIRQLLDIGFNLVKTEAGSAGPLSGKRVVFTGSMPKPRKEMEADAAKLGAEVQKSVSSKTDWLVTGERVGASKIAKAERLGVKTLPLEDYMNQLSAAVN